MCKSYTSCTGSDHPHPGLHYRCIELDEQKCAEDKTEFIIFSAKHYTYNQMSIKIGTNTIQHNNVKILGVPLDAHMILEKQLINTCRTSYMQIRKICSIRRYLTVYAVRTLVQVTVTVRLYYSNSIYSNLALLVPNRNITIRYGRRLLDASSATL